MFTFVKELNTENYTECTSKGVVLVDIWATWCGPCKILTPIIDEVGSYFGDAVLVGKLNADDAIDLVKELGVRNVPTVLVYKDGTIVDRFSGTKSKDDIIKFVETYL